MKLNQELVKQAEEFGKQAQDTLRAYKAKPLSLRELAETVSEELAEATRNYFLMNPKKTTFKINKKFTIRKCLSKMGMYEVHSK